MAAYESALAANAPLPGAGRHKEGTIGALVVSFYRSASFANLKPSSQKPYRLVLDKFAQEDGHRLVRDMPRRAAAAIIEKIGETRPGMANLTASIMKRLVHLCREIGTTRRITRSSVSTPMTAASTATWTDSEIAAYEAKHPLGHPPAPRLRSLLFTGQRVGDVAAMGRADLLTGAIPVKQEKTGAVLSLPVHPNLLRSLRACPADGPGTAEFVMVAL